MICAAFDYRIKVTWWKVAVTSPSEDRRQEVAADPEPKTLAL